MGKASSNKKVARAARASGRAGVRRNYTWPAVISGVVILGVLGILASLGGGTKSSGPPQPGEHWHAAYGVYVCGTFVPPFQDKDGDKEGIHTHGDGLQHIHPFFTRVSGKNANVEAFARDVGLELANDEVTGPGVPSKQNGDKCGSKVGEWKLVSWSSVDAKPKTRTSNFGSFAPKDQSVWVLAFTPEGAKVPQPDSVSELAHPSDLESPTPTGPVDTSTPSSTAPPEGSTSSSVPPESSSTTPSSTP
jgi:hypothetical protein